MTQFVPRVLVYIGRHVLIQDRQRGLKGLVPQGQLVVLLPQVGFNDFNCRQESQEGHVAACRPAVESIRSRDNSASQQTARGE